MPKRETPVSNSPAGACAKRHWMRFERYAAFLPIVVCQRQVGTHDGEVGLGGRGLVNAMANGVASVRGVHQRIHAEVIRPQQAQLRGHFGEITLHDPPELRGGHGHVDENDPAIREVGRGGLATLDDRRVGGGGGHGADGLVVGGVGRADELARGLSRDLSREPGLARGRSSLLRAVDATATLRAAFGRGLLASRHLLSLPEPPYGFP